MSMSDLSNMVNPVQLQASSTSYFSDPEEELDPQLFVNTTLKGWVRNGILQKLYGFLDDVYRHPDLWTRVWIAGSAVSFQWSADREPGDLDVLIGVDYISFRKAHPEYMGLSDIEISKMLNEDFREHLQPEMTNWNGFEVTFYVNPGATDIRTINPYAAYDLNHNEWTVFTKHQGATQNLAWESLIQKDTSMASEIVMRYSKYLTDLQGANTNYTAEITALQDKTIFKQPI
jgi:hypothetical protein